MRILAIDPGETVGMVVLQTSSDPCETPLVLSAGQHTDDILMNMRKFVALLGKVKPTVIVLEDYRIFASMAKTHVGQRLYTAELIGAIEAVGQLMHPAIPIVRVQPAKKGRWPKARLDAKFPDHKNLAGPHALAALQVGLVFLERENYWSVPIEEVR